MEDSLIQQRRDKFKKLLERGVKPYPNDFKKDCGHTPFWQGGFYPLSR